MRFTGMTAKMRMFAPQVFFPSLLWGVELRRKSDKQKESCEMRRTLNRKGERREENRSMNEWYRGDAIRQPGAASTPQRKSDTKVKCFLSTQRVPCFGCSHQLESQAGFSWPFSSKTQPWRKERHHPGLSALEIVSTHAEERQMVGRGASFWGEGT